MFFAAFRLEGSETRVFQNLPQLIRETHLLGRLVSLAALLLLAGATWLFARWLRRRLKGGTRFGLTGFENLAVPVDPSIPAEVLRAACGAIEQEIAEHPQVMGRRRPRVWLAGFGEGMRIKASAWLRRAAGRREVQRELLLIMRSRLEPHGPDGGTSPTER